MTPDPELLRRYAREGDEAAFAELVRRHVDLVYGAALRLAHGNTTLAEDATQAVFTDLARKAGKLLRHPTLTGWLHTSARYATLTAVRKGQTRRYLEQEASAMNDTATTPKDNSWAQLRPLLDEALGHLRERERDAVLLRFFQDKNYREVGGILGISEGAAQMRVERALEKLRGRFSRRGVLTTAALLASALGAHGAGTPAPGGFADSLAAKSLAGKDAIAPAGALNLKVAVIAVVLILFTAGFIIIWLDSAKLVSAKKPVVISNIELPKMVPAIATKTASASGNFARPNNLGTITFKESDAGAYNEKKFTLSSGTVLGMFYSNYNADGTFSVEISAVEPGNEEIMGSQGATESGFTGPFPLRTLIQFNVVSEKPALMTFANGETITFTVAAPVPDVNNLGILYFTPGVPLKFTLHSGTNFTLSLEDKGDYFFVHEAYTNSEGSYTDSSSTEYGQGGVKTVCEINMGELVFYTPYYLHAGKPSPTANGDTAPLDDTAP